VEEFITDNLPSEVVEIWSGYVQLFGLPGDPLTTVEAARGYSGFPSIGAREHIVNSGGTTSASLSGMALLKSDGRTATLLQTLLEAKG
jgi:hypothetical protein